MNQRRNPADAPSLRGVPTPPDTPDTPEKPQVREGVRVSGGTSGSDTPARRRPSAPQAPERAPAVPPKETAPASGQGTVVDDDTAPVKVGPGLGERLGAWAKTSFVPPEIWSEDRPSLSKQFAYAREGAWGPTEGWARKAALAAFWGVSFPTSVAAYGLEWIGERPSRWVTALVLLSLTWQIPYAPEVLGVLVRIPAWPITATWTALGLTSG